jgi:hypothetical protein
VAAAHGVASYDPTVRVDGDSIAVDWGPRTAEVAAVSMPILPDQFRLESVDYLKMDVEGTGTTCSTGT